MYEEFIETIKQDSFRGFNSLEYSDGGQELYVSFKTILRFTAENLNLFAGTQGSSGDEIIKIDWESDKPMFMFSTSISCNLQKCYIRNKLLQTSPGTLSTSTAQDLFPPFHEIDYFTVEKLTSLKDSMAVSTLTSPNIYPSIGNINNIYINAGYLLNVLLKESDNEDGKVSIRKYLQELCKGVNKALGSINDLQVIIDEDASTPFLTIIDFQQKRIKGLSGLELDQAKNRDVTVIKGQGLGSMLTNISAQSSITPEIASMISIGAQAQGYALGQEAVSFSRLSEGLLDKIYPQKFMAREEAEKQNKRAEEREAKAKQKFESVMDAYVDLVNKQQPIEGQEFGPIILTTDDQADYENVATDFYKYLLAKFTETGQTATGFIPIKLSFNMQGIGGMKIYQKFKLTDDILPLSYKSDYEFIIMGISHTVSNSKWDTTVSATISLIDPAVQELEKFSIPLLVGTADPGITKANCPAPGTNIESKGWGGFEKAFMRTELTYQEAKDVIVAATANKNLQIAALAIIIQEQGKGGKISGFNHNYGGFDITRGGWKFDTIGAINTNGYVLAPEGGTKCRIAYVSFRTAASFFKVKLKSLTEKGFGNAPTGNEVATLWYEKWNGYGARLFWENNINGYKETYKTVEEYDKFVVSNFAKTFYKIAKNLIG